MKSFLIAIFSVFIGIAIGVPVKDRDNDDGLPRVSALRNLDAYYDLYSNGKYDDDIVEENLLLRSLNEVDKIAEKLSLALFARAVNSEVIPIPISKDTMNRVMDHGDFGKYQKRMEFIGNGITDYYSPRARSLDSIGGGHLVKRQDSIGGGHLVNP